jgi:hypothetical protein
LPGAARGRFEWKDKKAPWYWCVLAVVFVLTLLLWIGFDFMVPHIGSRVPDSHHSISVSIYGGTYYVAPWAVWFHGRGGWIPGSCFVALALIQFVKGVFVARVR